MSFLGFCVKMYHPLKIINCQIFIKLALGNGAVLGAKKNGNE